MTARESLFTVIMLALAPLAARADPTAPLLAGTHQTLNAGPGDQIDPHIDGNLASYTSEVASVGEIRYFNFTTNTDTAIVPPGRPGQNFLSDVQGTRIVFTNSTIAGQQIAVFDSATSATTIVPGGTLRTNASIGGTLVAFEDRSFSMNPNESEIVAYDLATGVTTRLTNDAVMDVDPVVTPAGDAVVFTKCQTVIFGGACGLGDLYVARQTAPGVFDTAPITGVAGDNATDTNGTIVVYTSIRGGETDLFYQPIAGGTETQLDIAGEQRFPSVAGTLISFESDTPEGNFDLFVYDTATNTLYRVTQTPVDEWLPDITGVGDGYRIVYSAQDAGGNYDVFAFTFHLQQSAAEQITDLRDLLASFGLPRGIANSLDVKLRNALTALESGDTATACDLLGDFVNETRAQSGKHIPAARAEQLISEATRIREGLGCS